MRKVSVGLEADIGRFVAPVETAKKALDDFGDKVEAVDHKIDGLDRSTNKIPASAGKAGLAMKMLGGELDSVGDKVGSLGEKSAGLAVLDAKIRASQKEVRLLADEFQRTGDIDIFRRLGDASGKLDGLKAVRKKFADAIVITPDEAKGVFKHFSEIAGQFGTEAGKLFSGGLTGALSTPVLGPIIAGALIAALAAASTIILAVGGGAIIGAGALGGIGLGLAGAIMGDPQVTGAAWKSVIGDVKDQWLGASVALRGPLIEAAHQFGAAMANVHLDQILAKSAPLLQMLAAGAAGLARNLGGALETLVDGAGPVIAVLGAELPKIGKAFEMAFASIASEGEGGAQALKDMIQFSERLITTLGVVIGVAEKLYGKFAAFRDWTIPRSWLFTPDGQQTLDNAARKIEGTGTAARTATVDYKAFATALNETAATADTAIGSITDKVLDGMFAMDRATLTFEESLTRLKDAFRENGDATDIHTKKGQANREALIAAAEANKRVYDEMVAGGAKVGEATAKYEENTRALEDTARKAGFTKDEISDLIDRYGKVPGDVNTEVGAKGLNKVLGDLNETLRILAGLDGKIVNTYLHTHITTYYDDMGLGHQGQAGRAAGGPVKAGTSYVVGEHRPEVFTPSVDGMITPSISQYANMGSRAADMRAWGQMGTSGADPRSGAIAVQLSFSSTAGGFPMLLAQTLQEMQRTGQLQLTAS